LPNSLKNFNVTFDKLADCTNMVATLNGQKMTITPVEPVEKSTSKGAKIICSEKIVLTRQGDADLSTGTYTIKLDKVYPEARLNDQEFGEYEYSFYIGQVEVNPNDTIKDVVANTFATCQAGGIPEGYNVKFGEEERTYESTYGSGSRMFNFVEGGDFLKGLYFREGYVQYGAMEGYALHLEGGKKYRITFNSCMWKDNGSSMTFSILNPADLEAEAYLTKTINNTPNVNGNTGDAVFGSTKTTIAFTPEVDGDYILRWTSSDANGNQGWSEVLLANVSMKYIPEVGGLEETLALMAASPVTDVLQ
jgi:hypothetical protein